MRKPPAYPCPACGRARHRFQSGDLAVLCKKDWYALPDEIKEEYNAAGKRFLKNRRGELENMKAAREKLVQAAKDLRQNGDLFAQ